MREATPTKRRSFTILLGSHIATHCYQSVLYPKIFFNGGAKSGEVSFYPIETKLDNTQFIKASLRTAVRKYGSRSVEKWVAPRWL